MTKTSTCNFEGCTRPRKYRKLCNGHYAQQREGRPLQPLRRKIPQRGNCEVEGCTRPRTTNELCATHYQQFRKGKPITRIGEGRRPPDLSTAGLVRHILDNSTGTPSGCIEWDGTTNAQGYGVIRIDGRTCRVHRIMLETSRGTGLPGMHARHLCGNPICVNPDHLVWGTHEENMRDESAPCPAVKDLRAYGRPSVRFDRLEETPEADSRGSPPLLPL